MTSAAALAVVAYAVGPSGVSAAEPIEVVREVLLESGRFPIPYALAQTKEGGYVIAGSDQHVPWATRTDAQGNVQWRYVLPMKKWEPGAGDAEYEGATIMVDDSALLCGSQGRGDNAHPLILGMLTQIDKTGKVINHRALYPQGDQSFHLNHLRKCMPWGDGFAVIGQTSRWVGSTGSHRQERFYWVMALDARGEIRWEKLLSEAGSLGVLVQPNNDLVLSETYLGGTQITRIDATGAITVKRTIPIGASLVHPTVAEPVIRLVSGIHGTSLRILGEHLEDLGRVDGKVEMIRSETAYFLPDHSLLLFGYQREDSTDTASIARLSADLKEKRTFLFQPLWVSNNVSNALPTGTSAEFVTVRHVRTIKRWPDEKRVGLILAFIHVK